MACHFHPQIMNYNIYWYQLFLVSIPKIDRGIMTWQRENPKFKKRMEFAPFVGACSVRLQ
jgi:hypothetical protein